MFEELRKALRGEKVKTTYIKREVTREYDEKGNVVRKGSFCKTVDWARRKPKRD